MYWMGGGAMKLMGGAYEIDGGTMKWMGAGL